MDGGARVPIPHERIAEFCHRWRIVELALFGSVLRDDFGPESDIDVLVSFAPGVQPSLRDWLAMEEELAALFGRKVDLVRRELVETNRNYIIRKSILRSARPIYAA